MAHDAAAIVNFGSAICAFVAAYFWGRSTTAVVKDTGLDPKTSTLSGGEIYIGQVAVGKTSLLQSKLNRYAAGAAALAALLQAAALLISL